MPNVEIVSVGSELLLGQIVDTNSAWMAQRFATLGVDLFYKTIVGDNPDRMKDVISRASSRSDIVIVGGGLGPTQDDLTREIIAEVTDRKLVRDPDLLRQINQRFRSRGLVMTTNNEKQADIPENAIPVSNPNGTAPSFIVESSSGIIFALPGVPFELKWLFDNEVVPYLSQKFKLDQIITYRVLKVAEMGESTVDDRIGHLIANSKNPTVGVLAHPGQVDVRITAKAATLENASRLIYPVEQDIRTVLGAHVFAADEETMESVIGKLLRDKEVTIAVYEDLTGGMVTERFLQASPDHLVEGLVGNSTKSIRRLLMKSDCVEDINSDPILLTLGLAQGIRTLTGTTYGIAIHCTQEKCDMSENLGKGQTVVAVSDGLRSKTRTYNFAGRGRPDRTRLSMNVMELMRRVLLQGLE